MGSSYLSFLESKRHTLAPPFSQCSLTWLALRLIWGVPHDVL